MEGKMAKLPSTNIDDNSPPIGQCNICMTNSRNCLCGRNSKYQMDKSSNHLPQHNNDVSHLFAKGQSKPERIQLQEAMEQTKAGKELQTILDFYAADMETLNECFNKVLNSIEDEMDGMVRVYPFGSLITGLSLKESDIDLYLKWTGKQAMSYKRFFNKTNNLLHRSKCFTDVFAIRDARVPIIRCKHQLTGIKIDINMSNPNSTYNSQFVCALMQKDDRLRQLSLFIKIWAKKLKINGNGSMTSYCLCILIIYYLQQRNMLQSIKWLQSKSTPNMFCGVNYAYNLNRMPDIPSNISTLNLISGFFKYYNTMDWESTLISPYLGYSLKRELVSANPNAFPEYQDQLLAIENATGENPEVFQLGRIVCVQDPFELGHNVAKSITKISLIYIKKCFGLAAEACSNDNLMIQRKKLYDYLLFGLLEKLEENKLAAQPQSNKRNCSSNMHSHILYPCTNDIKALNLNLQLNVLQAEKSIYFHWMKCYIDTIKDILIRIYNLQVQDLDIGPEELPLYYKWQISTSVNTWTDRNFTHIQNISFFNHQLQQTRNFVAAAATKKVNLDGYFVMKASSDYKQLQLEVHSLPNNAISMQKNGTLTRFFKSLKNLLSNYSFQEKIIIWKSLESGTT